VKIFHEKKHKILFVLLIIVGVGLRYIVSFRGYNFDFESYQIVVNILKQNGNVYAVTDRYNYGPIWFFILQLLYFIASENYNIFRILLITILTIADIGIFVFVRKRFGKMAGFFFFLNPISIIITGYHNQFDNIAILFGILAIAQFEKDDSNHINKKFFLGLIYISLSLITKHLLFLFPIWLALKQKSCFKKLLSIIFPYVIFLMSFLPFWKEGNNGIINNVFLYKSWNNGVFYN